MGGFSLRMMPTTTFRRKARTIASPIFFEVMADWLIKISVEARSSVETTAPSRLSPGAKNTRTFDGNGRSAGGGNTWMRASSGAACSIHARNGNIIQVVFIDRDPL